MTKPRTSGDLRVGLIGYSLGGAIFHAPLIAATSGLKLAAIVTSNEERRVQAQTDFPEADIVLTGYSFLDDSDQRSWGYHHGGAHRSPVHSTHKLDSEGAYLRGLVERGEARYVA
jgi:hypothetical protein